MSASRRVKIGINLGVQLGDHAGRYAESRNDCVLIRKRPDEDGNWGDLIIKRGLKCWLFNRPAIQTKNSRRGSWNPKWGGYVIKSKPIRMPDFTLFATRF